MPAEIIDSRLLGVPACSPDGLALRIENGGLCCAEGHEYKVINDVPVFLQSEKDLATSIAAASLKAAETGIGAPLYLDTIGLSEN